LPPPKNPPWELEDIAGGNGEAFPTISQPPGVEGGIGATGMGHNAPSPIIYVNISIEEAKSRIMPRGWMLMREMLRVKDYFFSSLAI
jgi:hypothetical protein